MKKILIILCRGSLNGIKQLESITALLVMSTYGLQVTVCFSGQAITLLSQVTHTHTPTLAQPFKSITAMIDSFEFYDVLPVWVDADSCPDQPRVDCTAMRLTAETLQQFDAVLRW